MTILAAFESHGLSETDLVSKETLLNVINRMVCFILLRMDINNLMRMCTMKFGKNVEKTLLEKSKLKIL